ncbi:E2/UBC family protein [Kitasatospora sp. NPDC001603]|uniref:E2/UBC family protein n=1 Tax=Kitasatospora sp. NPDC001603 TaxID=3154388 RepID=UPI00332CD33D
MDLPTEDHTALREAGFTYDVSEDGGMLCIQITDVPLPEGLNATKADILLRLHPLYPDVPPDMWWTSPSLTTAAGGTIPATEVHETHRGRTWQRWSRHLPPSAWQPGTDSLKSYLTLLRAELAIAGAAA